MNNLKREAFEYLKDRISCERDELTGCMIFPADGPTSRYKAPREMQYMSVDEEKALENVHGLEEWYKEQRTLNAAFAMKQIGVDISVLVPLEFIADCYRNDIYRALKIEEIENEKVS